MLSTRNSALKVGTTLKRNDGKKVFKTNGNKKQSGIAILIYDQTDIKLKLIISLKESYQPMNQLLNMS